MKKILIRGGWLFDGSTFKCADLLIEGDRIAKIEKNITDSADVVFDATDKLVTPGLIDVHAHLRAVSPDSIGAPVESCTFPFGVTAAADASAVQGDATRLDASMLKSAVFVCADVSDDRAVFDKTEKMLSLYGERVVGIKLYFDTNVANMSSSAPLREASTFARERGLKFMAHVTRSPIPLYEIVSVMDEGEIISHAFHGGVNSAQEDGLACLLEAKRRGVLTDVGFAGNVHADFSILKQAICRGIYPDLLGTDITKNSMFVRGGRYGLTMCMSIVRSMGMDENSIFRAVTQNAARALGKENEWGSLAVGRAADIAVFEYADEGYDITDKEGNRISDDRGYRCLLTLCDGQVVYRR